MRAMVWTDDWGHDIGRSWRHRGRFRPPVPLALLPPVVLGLGVAAIVALAVGVAFVATVAAVLFAAALTAGICGILGFISWQILRHAIPGLHGRRRSKRGRRRDERTAVVADTPVDVLRRRYAAGDIGQTAFRRQLTDLLKERYVRGDLTLAEFESRVQHLYQDPALQPPTAV